MNQGVSRKKNCAGKQSHSVSLTEQQGEVTSPQENQEQTVVVISDDEDIPELPSDFFCDDIAEEDQSVIQRKNYSIFELSSGFFFDDVPLEHVSTQPSEMVARSQTKDCQATEVTTPSPNQSTNVLPTTCRLWPRCSGTDESHNACPVEVPVLSFLCQMFPNKENVLAARLPRPLQPPNVSKESNVDCRPMVSRPVSELDDFPVRPENATTQQLSEMSPTHVHELHSRRLQRQELMRWNRKLQYSSPIRTTKIRRLFDDQNHVGKSVAPDCLLQSCSPKECVALSCAKSIGICKIQHLELSGLDECRESMLAPRSDLDMFPGHPFIRALCLAEQHSLPFRLFPQDVWLLACHGTAVLERQSVEHTRFSKWDSKHGGMRFKRNDEDFHQTLADVVLEDIHKLLGQEGSLLLKQFSTSTTATELPNMLGMVGNWVRTERSSAPLANKSTTRRQTGRSSAKRHLHAFRLEGTPADWTGILVKLGEICQRCPHLSAFVGQLIKTVFVPLQKMSRMKPVSQSFVNDFFWWRKTDNGIAIGGNILRFFPNLCPPVSFDSQKQDLNVDSRHESWGTGFHEMPVSALVVNSGTMDFTMIAGFMGCKQNLRDGSISTEVGWSLLLNLPCLKIGNGAFSSVHGSLSRSSDSRSTRNGMVS